MRIPLRTSKCIFRIIPFLLFFIHISLSAQDPRYINTKDHSVLINALANEADNSITLSWLENDLELGYKIERRKLGASYFPISPLAELEGKIHEFVDNGVEPGQIYEYKITGLRNGSVSLTFERQDGTEFDSAVAFNFNSYGYILAGVKAVSDNQTGRLLLLVDETIAEPLQAEIERYKIQAANEGWDVVSREVPRTEKFDGNAVVQVKSVILDVYTEYQDLSHIFILGRVAVPYSGRINPDAHKNHIGAWPADVYYGIAYDNNWKDQTIYDTSASRQQNRNIPGDGKFDISMLSTAIVNFAVGRVDFYDMPEFEENEIELLRNYLDKNYQYRTGNTAYQTRGLVDDNFGAKKYLEGFGSSGWRNLASLCGKDNVVSLDWFTTLEEQSYLWAYGCGGGTYIKAGGIGFTENFANAPAVNAVFTMLFGSYFGDWDSQNNFLRASLASKPSILTCAWAGRPPWYFHHMAAGMNIGFSTVLSQTNSTEYLPNGYFLNGPNGNASVQQYGTKQVHAALMGDPTLRMFMGNKAPENFKVTSNENGTALLTWNSPDGVSDDHYFDVYQDYLPDNESFEKINIEPVRTNSFDIGYETDGDYKFKLVLMELKETNTGSFYMQGECSTVQATLLDVPEDERANSLISQPNPATDNSTITISMANPAELRVVVYDIAGLPVKTLFGGRKAAGSHSIAWSLTDDGGHKLPAGVYFIHYSIGSQSGSEKIVILR